MALNLNYTPTRLVDITTLSCQRRHYPDCEWVHLKQFYLEEEQHGD